MHADPQDLCALDPRLGFIVHSHLRWDFVWQRPQQLLSRFARDNPVLFVEEPLFADDLAAPELVVSSPMQGVYRAIPKLPRGSRAEPDEATATVRKLTAAALRGAELAGRFDRRIQWFYTPMPAEEMLGAFGEEAVVYDCMDELSQFRFAPGDIARRERLLLSRADLVFTGGWRLYEAKTRYHSNVHFFGCGVDAEHFARARAPETIVPADVRQIAPPILGYFGVIDERLDYDLLRRLAAARPDWTLLMIGPVLKVAPDELPNAPNIRWLGMRDYAQLPAYLKAFDVCLMPFAMNEATEFINPTKTLEYMAAGKPIVSTPVADVVRNFSRIVHIADTAEEFTRRASAAVARSDLRRIGRGIDRAAASSWEAIVGRMRALIAGAVAERHGSATGYAHDDVLPAERASPGGASLPSGSVHVAPPSPGA